MNITATQLNPNIYSVYPVDSDSYMLCDIRKGPSNNIQETHLLNCKTGCFIDLTEYVGQVPPRVLCWNLKDSDRVITWNKYEQTILTVHKQTATFLQIVRTALAAVGPDFGCVVKFNFVMTKLDLSDDKVKVLVEKKFEVKPIDELHVLEKRDNMYLTQHDQTLIMQFLMPQLPSSGATQGPRYTKVLDQELTLIMNLYSLNVTTITGTTRIEQTWGKQNLSESSVPTHAFIKETEWLSNSTVVPVVDYIKKTSVLFDLESWNETLYLGLMIPYYNKLTKKYYYGLTFRPDNQPPMLLYEKVQPDNRTDKMIFKVNKSCKTETITLIAHNNDETEKYGLSFDSVDKLYEKISDAINGTCPDVKYSYTKTETDVTMTIEIQHRYSFETLKYCLTKIPVDPVFVLQKRMDYLYDMIKS